MEKRVTIIIPTWKPGAEFAEVLRRLRRQSVKPERILIVNTEEQYFRQDLISDWTGISMLHIEKKDFDHAGTRDMAAGMTDTPFILFMTMDAIPADTRMIEKLLTALEDPKTAVAYARQLPKKESSTVERYIRSFNYPEESSVRTWEDTRTEGVKAFFCSNVCAAYRTELYRKLGGFDAPAIFNEDMVFAGKALQEGYRIAYCADAKVYHSHDYSDWMQLRRNFDLGVSQRQHPELFEGLPSEGTGVQMIREVSLSLLRKGRLFAIPALIRQSAWKYVGYRLGYAYRSLPVSWVRRFSMNRTYWERNSGK